MARKRREEETANKEETTETEETEESGEETEKKLRSSEGPLDDAMDAYGLRAFMHPVTFLKIYGDSDNDFLTKDEFLYFVINESLKNIESDQHTPENFGGTIANIKYIYSFLDCDGEDDLSATDLIQSFQRLKIHLTCDGENVEFRPNNKCINRFVQVAQVE